MHWNPRYIIQRWIGTSFYYTLLIIKGRCYRKFMFLVVAHENIAKTTPKGRILSVDLSLYYLSLIETKCTLVTLCPFFMILSLFTGQLYSKIFCWKIWHKVFPDNNSNIYYLGCYQHEKIDWNNLDFFFCFHLKVNAYCCLKVSEKSICCSRQCMYV